MILLLISFIFYALVFCIAKVKGKHSIIDVFWGMSFVVLALSSFFLYSEKSIGQIIVLIGVVIWGLRLTIHLYKRNMHKEEDYRYVDIKRKLESNLKSVPMFIKEFIYIYVMQMVLSFIISCSFITLFLVNGEQNLITMTIGVILLIVGFVFEFVGDFQLTKYMKNKPTPVLNTGLWKYTRHPNYFGEVVVWYAIFFMSITSVLQIWTFISPLTINLLIYFVSGIPLLEKKMMKREEYKKYAIKTNKFIPWFVKGDINE